MTPCESTPEPWIDRNFIASAPVRPETRSPRDEGADRKIEQTIAYMTQHLNEPLPVARLAALANVSPSHFFALFKRRTGCAPIDFFIRLRMHHACRLLEQTSLNVKEVAAVLGYDDPFYFSRVFKSVNRVAPTEYRTMGREAKDHEPSGATARFSPSADAPGAPGNPAAWQNFRHAEQFDRPAAATAS